MCCRQCKPEVVTYSDLNALLLDADGNQPARLEESGEDLTVLGFYHNVLQEEPKPQQVQNTNDGSFSEPLL